MCVSQAPSSREQQMSATIDQQAVWVNVQKTYQSAQDSGAASKFKTNTQILTDQRLQIKFVLRVSESLRDKPKPPKSR